MEVVRQIESQCPQGALLQGHNVIAKQQALRTQQQHTSTSYNCYIYDVS
jgi:hypothetical protein